MQTTLTPFPMSPPSAAAFHHGTLTLAAFGEPEEVGALMEKEGRALASRLSLTPLTLSRDAAPHVALLTVHPSTSPGSYGVLLSVPTDPGGNMRWRKAPKTARTGPRRGDDNLK